MNMRIGIMGFGRIGRNVFRLARKEQGLSVGAIVDLAEPEALAYLLRFDTVFGRFEDPFTIESGAMKFAGESIPMLTHKDPSEVDWKGLGVDIVVDCTHKYRTRKALEGHLARGAKKVVLASPPLDDLDFLTVMGVNDAGLQATHALVSAASPTSNALALVLSVLHDTFGVERGFVNAVHAYTNEQRLADVPHTEIRRSRAAAENIIPSATWAPMAIGKIIPALAGKLDGIAMNVPVPDGSTLDLTTEMRGEVTPESVNAAMKLAADGRFKGIMEYTEQPIVSSDVIGNAHSVVFDALSTQVVGGNLLKTISWYDNGWGYACRVVELVKRLAALGVGTGGGK